ncbi:hypothetical protein GCM10010402_13520 [Actinomadura luteofluorescens]
MVSISVFLSESGNYLAPRVARAMSISLIERIGIGGTHVKKRGGATASPAVREGKSSGGGGREVAGIYRYRGFCGECGGTERGVRGPRPRTPRTRGGAATAGR